MRTPLLNRITRWFILGLAIILIIIVPIIALTGYATSPFFPCLVCHGPGKAAYVLKPEIVTEAWESILPLEEMRVKHGDLLREWRELVVREGKRTYVAPDGKEYNISLKSLVPSKQAKQACDQCHRYAQIIPKKLNCWACHTLPKRN